MSLVTTFGVIGAMQKGGQLEASWKGILEDMSEYGVEPDDFILSTTKRISSTGERAIPGELEYLKGGGAWRLHPKLVTWLMARSNREPGGWKASLQLFYAMSEHAPKMIGVYHYSAAITACDKGGGDQWERAEEIFIDMVKCGVEPNVVTFNTLISIMGKGGQWERAVRVFKDMQTRCVKPNVNTYNALIATMGNCGQWEKEDMLTREMKQVDVTYRVIFDVLEGNMRSKEVDALFKADQGHQNSVLIGVEQQQAACGVHKPCLSGFTKQHGRDLCIDLHHLSASQARVVVRCCVGDLADIHGSGREAVIIVGKSAVGPAVKTLLSDEMKMVCAVDPGSRLCTSALLLTF